MKCQIQFSRKNKKTINLLSAELAQRVVKVNNTSTPVSFCVIPYCAFDIFQKVFFCLALYTEEVYLQPFVII